MKKLMIIAAAAALFCATPAQAQGILGRIAGAAGKAVGSAIGKTVGDAVNDKVKDAVDKNTPDELKDLGSMAENLSTGVTGTQAFPPRRYSTFGWDGVVTPSSAQYPVPLMNEFPAVPAAADLVNPVEEKQIAYYQAIKRVTLRAEELNESNTCDDEATLAWREKTNGMLKEIFGLSDADIALMAKEERTEAEEQYLSEKIAKGLLGENADLEKLAAEAEDYQGMTTNEMISDTYSKTELAVFAVYDAHNAELKKYTGFSAQDYKDAYHLNMKDEKAGAARNKEMEAARKAFVKGKDASFQKEADAFQKSITKELTQAALGGSGVGMMAGGVLNTMGKVQPLMDMEKKLVKYYQDIMAAIPKSQATAVDAAFSAAERQKVLDLKNKIYSTEDHKVYNPLYLEALELIMSYRERAAKVWVADVQKRFDEQKNAVANVTKINRQAIEDELLPECALYRFPLNMVITAGDILAEAYSEFPSDYPKMYLEEVQREIVLSDGRMPWWPEWTVFGDRYFDDLLAGKYIFCSDKNGKVYQFNSGTWSELGNSRVKELEGMKKTAAPASQSWTSQDGKRKVIYNAEGGFFQLPEGDLAYPDAWKVEGNKIQWIHVATEDTGNGNYKYQLVLCTYKL